jgi:hypothetical protein
MKTPFRITFRKTISKDSNVPILENFKRNFERSKCDEVSIISETELIVRNEFFHPEFFRSRWNIWSGISTARIVIFETPDKSKSLVTYCINFSCGILTQLIFLALFTLLIARNSGVNGEHVWIFFIIFFSGIVILNLLILIILHWEIFIRTVKNKNENLGKYDWAEILRSKSNNELRAISCGRTAHNDEVRALAKSELERRINDFEAKVN